MLTAFVLTMSTVCADCVCVHHEYCFCAHHEYCVVLTVCVHHEYCVCVHHEYCVCAHHEYCVVPTAFVLTISTVLCWMYLCSPRILFILTVFELTMDTMCTEYVSSDHDYRLCLLLMYSP